MSGNRAPSAFALERAMSELLAVREQLLAADPGIEQDQQLLHDMLEGEGGDALQVLERVIEASVDAAALAAAARLRREDLAERQARYERRCDTLRSAALAAMQALGLQRLERGSFTATIRQGTPSVVAPDPEDLPDEYVRIERKADKQLIGAALRSGVDVPNARFSNAPPSLAIRTR